MGKRTMIIAVLSLAAATFGYGLVQAHSAFAYNQDLMGIYSSDDSYCGTAPSKTLSKELNKEEASNIVAYQLRRFNDRLKVGEITEAKDAFDIQVVTKEGEILVDRLLVSKSTGFILRVDQ